MGAGLRGVVAKRFAGLALTLLVASFVVYGSIFVSPGSPEDVLFGAHPPAPRVRAEVRHYLGLDEGFLPRYFHWLGNVLTGDLGTSLITQQSVGSRIAHPAVISLALIGYAAILIMVGGIGLGVLAALRPGPVDGAITVAMSVATALPAFVASALTISLFSVRLGWFPSSGLGDGFGGWLQSLTLPAVSLAVISSGLVARVTRASTREQATAEHTQTALMRGVSRRRTIRSHILRNAAAPIITVTGLQVAGLLTGAVVVEQAFGLGGLGQLLISSVQQKDFPVVQAIALLIVVTFVVLNTLADLTSALLDPRARAGIAS